MSPFMVVLGALAVLLAAGLLVRLLDRRETRQQRARTEDALKHLFDQEYRGRKGSFTSLGGVLRLDDRRLMQLLARMQQQGLVVASGQEFQLTTEGSAWPGRSSAPTGCSSGISRTKRGCRCATFTPLPNAANTR